MSTLAQMLVENDRVNGILHSRLRLDDVKKCLKFFDAVKSSLSMVSEKRAERFAFADDPLLAYLELTRNMSDEALSRAIVMPSPVTWLEWTVRYGDGPRSGEETRSERFGYMVSEKDGTWLIASCMDTVFGVIPVFVTEVRIPTGRHVATASRCWLISGRDEALVGWCQQTVRDVVAALFLLSVPRVCEVREGASTRLQRARIRRGKLPLVEVRRVHLAIGVGRPRYGSRSEPTVVGSEGIHHRYHSVISHLRVYHQGTERQRVAVVPKHWRGNKELGIILKEHDVR